MKKLTVLFVLLSTMCFAQEKAATPISGNRVILKQDKVKGYQLMKVKDSRGDTLLVSEDLMDDIKTKMGTKASPSDKIGFQMIVDQDAFLDEPINEDRDYTMGMQLTIGGTRKKTRFVRWLFGLSEDEIAANWSGTMSFSGFTPLHIERNYIDLGDRPYAALFTVSTAGMYSFNKEIIAKGLTRSTFFRSTSLIGFMGSGTSSKAKFIQTAVHSGQRAVADDPNDVRPDPKGWEFAIASKSDLAVVANYNADYAKEFEYTFPVNTGVFAPLKAVFKPGVGVAIGNLYDYATAGAQFQLGFFSKSVHSGNNDGGIFDLVKNRSKFEVSFVGEFFAQAWAHNATLSGILFNRDQDLYHLNYNQIEKFTNYYSYGLELSYKRILSLGYSKVVRSAVMKSVDREQAFGRFVLRVNM